MFHLDNNSGIEVMPIVQQTMSRLTKWFTEGDTKSPPSYPGADWFNIVQAELLNVLKEANIDPDKTNLNQLSSAIKNLVAAGGFLPAKKESINSTETYNVDDIVNFKVAPSVDNIELVYLIDSYRKGYSWYEKYSNGVVKQAGISDISTASSQSVVHKNVNLLVPVVDNSFCVNLTAANSAGGWGYATHTFSAQSKTGFIISSYFTLASTYTSQVYWETRGYYK